MVRTWDVNGRRRTKEAARTSQASGSVMGSDGAAADHGGPRHWRSRSCGALGVAGNTSTVSQRPMRQCGQTARSMPATRLRKAAASSWARGFGAGMARVSVITQFDGLMFTYRDGPARTKFLFDRSRRKVAAGARPWVES